MKNKKAVQLAKTYIMKNIDLAEYCEYEGIPLDNSVEKLKNVFIAEKHQLTRKSAEDWLRGLPSVVTHAFMTNETNGIVLGWGILNKRELKTVDTDALYWTLLGDALFQLLIDY